MYASKSSDVSRLDRSHGRRVTGPLVAFFDSRELTQRGMKVLLIKVCRPLSGIWTI